MTTATKTEIIAPNRIPKLVERIDEIAAGIDTLSTDEIVTLFADVKPLEKAVERLTAKARVELIERRGEAAGNDDRGAHIFAGERGGVKVSYVGLKPRPNALDILKKANPDIEMYLPRKFSQVKAEAMLKSLNVEALHYTDAEIKTETIERLAKEGQISEAVAMRAIDPESGSFRVEPIAADKLPRE